MTQSPHHEKEGPTGERLGNLWYLLPGRLTLVEDVPLKVVICHIYWLLSRYPAHFRGLVGQQKIGPYQYSLLQLLGARAWA